MADIRKCKFCKENIDVDTDDFYNGSFIIDEKTGAYMHTGCYKINRLSLKKNRPTEEDLEDDIFQRQKYTKKEVKQKIAVRKLYDFLYEKYEVTYLPKYVFIKFSSIFNGTHKSISKPIPASDLYDMWIRQYEELERQNNARAKKGKKIEDGVGRINYDLAVLLGKYDSYLNWKKTVLANKKKVKEELENNNLEIISTEKVKANLNKRRKEELDIADIIDEI